jgi:hypothetical protein
MSAMQRNKGKTGEREVASIIRELTGYDCQRRVRQHDGDSDLLGVPGWSVEVKNTAPPTLGDVRTWWAQAIGQTPADELPVLVYKRQRGEWRAVWPLACLLMMQRAEYWTEPEWTAETTLEAWAAVAMEVR